MAGAGWLTGLWRLDRPKYLVLMASLSECLDLLITATKPSQMRLHHNELFTEGRRYHIAKIPHGFSMQTTSKSYWRYTEGLFHLRPKTKEGAVLRVSCTEEPSGYTRFEIHSRMRWDYLLDVLAIPVFMGWLIFLMRWEWWMSGALVGGILALNYGVHRFNAAYQANEMLYFIEKVLEAKQSHDVPALSATHADVVYQSFSSAWEQFYQEHQ